MTENNRIEYKRELTEGLEKEVVAFLNYKDGGVIYMGIDSGGEIIGVSDCDKIQLVVKDRLKNNIQPSPPSWGCSTSPMKNGKEWISSESRWRVALRNHTT